MLRGVDDGLTSFEFRGNPSLASSYVAVARVLLIGYLSNTTDQALDLARHRWRLADGAEIEILSNNGVNRIVIDVRSVTGQESEGLDLLLIYEFAAQNTFPVTQTIKWFRLFFDPLKADEIGESPWSADVQDTYEDQLLPTEKKPDNGIECSPVGLVIIHCGASKTDHITWNGPVTPPDGNPFYALRGAGDMVHVDYHANRYCNYMVETGRELFWWYGTTGRGELDSPDFGANSPIGEGWRYVDGVKVLVAVAPSGLVIVTREDTGQVGTKEANLPDWTKANELGNGFAAGCWKLNSDCTRAISVLHGNSWVFDAYDPGFDTGSLLDNAAPPEIGGAFQSAVFELQIGIGFDFNGVPEIAIQANEITDIEYVLTGGLAFGIPEKHSNGSYWYAADYGIDDEILTARIVYYTREITTVEYEENEPDPATPYANIETVEIAAESGQLIDTDPCSIGGFGTTRKFTSVRWWATDHTFLRRVTTDVDVRLECTGMDDFILRRSHVVDDLSAKWGPAGSQSVWLWSDGGIGSYDVEGYVRAVANNTQVDCVTWHTRSSGFLNPTSMGEGGSTYFYTKHITRDPSEERRLMGLDLRAKTILYSEVVTEWSDDVTGSGEVYFPIGGGSTWNGCYQESGYTVTDAAGIISPVLTDKKETNVDETPEPDPYCEQWAEFYGANQSDEDSYPLNTKLWHQMVLGKPNPKTPALAGGFIGPFVDWGEYYPYQMIASTPDSINWHPLGLFGVRFPQAEVDIISYIDPDGTVHQTSHTDVLDFAVDEDAEPISDEDKARLRSVALSTRGEWVVRGPVDQLEP